MTRRGLVVVVLAAATLVGLPAIAALHDPVISSNEPLPFPKNGQNEPALALDRAQKARGPLLVAAGNDYRDQAVCMGQSACSFNPGIGISGLYYANDHSTWIRAMYPRPAGSLAGPSIIRTLPNFPKGMWSFGDPAVAAGPRRRVDGTFAWSLGTRFYYATLAASAHPTRTVMVFLSDPVGRVVQGRPQPIWRRPRRALTAGPPADKPAIWADDAQLAPAGKPNPNFGHVYVCWTAFSTGQEAAGGEIWFARSVDGGVTWKAQQQLSSSRAQAQGCTIRSDSAGRVYVLWRERTPSPQNIQVQSGIECAGLFKTSIQMAESTDGIAFTAPSMVAKVLEPGLWDRTQGQCTADGVTGARINSFPSLDIANGAPNGVGRDTIALATLEGGSDRVVIRTSHDHGATWSGELVASRSNDNPAFPAVALAPNGSRIYLVYTNFLQVWQTDTGAPRLMQAVVRTAPLKNLEAGGKSGWSDVGGAKGDARASAGFEGGDADPNTTVRAEFLGDYNAIVATNAGADAAWTDVSAAADCSNVDIYRGQVAKGKEQLPILNVRKLCLPKKSPPGRLMPTFGNTTLCGIHIPAIVPPGTQETQCATDLHP